MRIKIKTIVALLMSAGAAACASGMSGHSPQASTANAGAEAGAIITTTLTYHRPSTFQSAGRPYAIYVIVDYRNASAVKEYPGSWDDQTQSLSAAVSVPLRAENLVYVEDLAIAPGAATPLDAARGSLKEISCPLGVDPLHACYLLQVLH